MVSVKDSFIESSGFLTSLDMLSTEIDGPGCEQDETELKKACLWEYLASSCLEASLWNQ